MVHYFRETAVFCSLLKRALKTYRSWENIIFLLKTRSMNRCMCLFCHHTDGQKTFSCHGNKMYSATNEKEIYKSICLASCYIMTAAAEFEFYCPETSTQNPPDHVSP